jgi:hypothetical protein
VEPPVDAKGVKHNAYAEAQARILDLQRAEEKDHGREATIEDDRQDIALATEHKLITDQIWARFDLFFGIFVLLNGLSIGMNAESPYDQGSNRVMSTKFFGMLTVEQADFAGRQMERIFLGIFGMEFIMRAMLHYQLEYSFNYEQILGFIPPPDEVQWRRVLLILPEFMDPRRDAWVLFDFILVSMAAGEEVIRYVYRDGRRSIKFNHFLILRVFRVFRLFRLVRVLRLMRTLKLLVDGMLVSVRILTYALLLLGMALFGFTIITFEFMKDVDGTESYRKDEQPMYFGSLFRGILTMFQVTTFADWTDLYRLVTDKHGYWAKVLHLLLTRSLAEDYCSYKHSQKVDYTSLTLTYLGA